MPARRASDKPIAIACLRLVTFFPLRPLLSFPCFISCISSRTYSPALGLYFLPLLFFFADFFEDPDFDDRFFVAVLFELPVLLDFLAVDREDRDELFFFVLVAATLPPLLPVVERASAGQKVGSLNP